MNTIRSGLPPLPQHMRHLPIDHRGYPVPYFVAWVDGKPDHRIIDGNKLPLAIKTGRCWMCGQKQFGALRYFCIGPMCSITRAISEPPSHLDCLRYAVRACPFLTRPRAIRRGAHLPQHIHEPAGEGLRRNPGAVCIWGTQQWRPWHPPGGGILFELGDPEMTEWYAEGRPATRAEVDASIDSGLPLLRESAQQQGLDAVAELERRVMWERLRLDVQTWPDVVEDAA